MKQAALMLCLMATPMLAGCVFHHEVIREREPSGEPSGQGKDEPLAINAIQPRFELVEPAR